MYMSPFFQGFAMGGGLIVAIGAQNAFVLTQGVRRNHHMAVAVLCILCDGALIALGVSGVGGMVAASPALGTAAVIRPFPAVARAESSRYSTRMS